MSLNIGVFLGSRASNDKKVNEQINKFANWIVKNNHTLVIGGTDQGLMKNLAEIVYNRKCEVRAIYTKNIYKLSKKPNFFSELIITNDTYSKKRMFENLSDVFVAFPGGLGTLDEIVDVINKNALQEIKKKIFLINESFYWNKFRELLDFFESKNFLIDREFDKFFHLCVLDDFFKEIKKIDGKNHR